MLTESRFSISTTAELGDALLTLIKHDVMQPTPESDSRRRLETFVLRAEMLVTRLTERQEALEQTQAGLLRQVAVLRYQILALIDGHARLIDRLTTQAELADRRYVEQAAELQRWRVQAEADRQAQAARAVALGTRLDARHEAAAARLAALEARTLPAWWSRVLARLRALWRPRAAR